LSGANHEFLKLNPIKFLIDHARVKATEEGYTYFNLGGGLGGDPNDSLFKFKSSFSDDFHDFFVWKLVVNESIYKALCNENKPSVDTDFFPLYRYNETLN
jgi:lipid II:glycine glycyltransferase (peptidoglycan interpeptide bridge formation enzyme)